MTPPSQQTQRSFEGIRFSLFGTPVLVRPYFLLLGLVFGAAGGSLETGAAWVGVIFVSVLMHEMGHATVMRLYGFSPRIELHAMGGATSWSREKSSTPTQRLWVTLAGPAAGLLLGGLVKVVMLTVDSSSVPLAEWALKQAYWANIAWSLINLLPILPWDGGMVVDSLTELVGRKPRPRVAAGFSMVFGVLVVASALLLFKGYPMLLYLGGVGIWTGWTRWTRPPASADSVAEARALLDSGEHAAAEVLVRQALTRTADPTLRAQLLEVLGWCRIAVNDWSGAEQVRKAMGSLQPSRLFRARLAMQSGGDHEVLELLAPPVTQPAEVKLRAATLLGLGRVADVMADARALLAMPPTDDTRSSAYLLCAALFYAGDYRDALTMCRESFEVLHEPVFLFNAACCLARLEHRDEAMAELTRAVDAGYANTEELLHDDDLSALKSQPGWPELLKRLPPASG